MDKKKFQPNVNQGYVVTIEGRIGSLNVNKPDGYAAEVERMQNALEDVLSRLSTDELVDLRLSQNKEMTPEEEVIAKEQMRKDMDENRDRPSI